MGRIRVGAPVIACCAVLATACAGPTPPAEHAEPQQTAAPAPAAASEDAAPEQPKAKSDKDAPAAADSAEKAGDEDGPGPVARFFANTRRIGQCNDLIEVINQEQNTIRNANTGSAAAMRRLAEALDGVVEKVQGIDLSDDKLLIHRSRYVQLIGDFSRVSRRTADAMDAKDLELLQEVQKALKDIGPRESVLVNDLNTYCQGE